MVHGTPRPCAAAASAAPWLPALWATKPLAATASGVEKTAPNKPHSVLRNPAALLATLKNLDKDSLPEKR